MEEEEEEVQWQSPSSHLRPLGSRCRRVDVAVAVALVAVVIVVGGRGVVVLVVAMLVLSCC